MCKHIWRLLVVVLVCASIGLCLPRMGSAQSDLRHNLISNLYQVGSGMHQLPHNAVIIPAAQTSWNQVSPYILAGIVFILIQSVIIVVLLLTRSRRKLTERDLLKNALIFDRITDAIIITSPEGEITLWNRGAELLYGYTKEEALGQPVAMLYDEDNIAVLMEMIAQLRQDIEIPAMEVSVVDKFGNDLHILLSLTTLKDEHGNITEFVGIQKNITERLQWESDLRQERDRAQSYLDIANVMFLVLDSDETISLVNRKASEILGFPQQEIVGKNWFDLFISEPAREDVRGVFRKLMAGELASVSEYVNPIVNSQGEERLISWHNTDLRDEEGNISGILSSGEDITERAKAEAELAEYREHLEVLVEQRTDMLNARIEEVERLNTAILNTSEELKTANRQLERTSQRLTVTNRDLEDFAYVVSHDLKAPLRGISQISTWVISDYRDNLDEQGQHLLDLLVDRVQRMHTLIDGVLMYSRLGRQSKQEGPVDLQTLVPEIVAMLAPPEHITIDIDGPLPVVTGDTTRLTQLFQNLLDNAIKYMDKPQGLIRINVESEQEQWLFSITDNGCGIDKRHFERIFKLFQTLKPATSASTGVGLALVKRIVESSGGKIWLESEVGQGTTFFFTYPKRKQVKP